MQGHIRAGRREPAVALYGGADGFDLYRQFLARVPALLKPGGLLVAEIGSDQTAVALSTAAQVAPGWPLGALVLGIGVFFYTLTNVTSAAVLDTTGGRLPASTMGLTMVLTQVIVLPAPVLAGWLAERSGYGAAFGLAAGFMGLGALILSPLRLYRGSGRTPRFAA